MSDRVPDAGPLRWRTFAALIIVPALWAAFLIARHGVNVPYYDQWIGMAPLFEAMEAGTLTAGDFTHQHNEHRLPIPRLIFFAAGKLTHWNTRAEMFLTWTVLAAIAAILWKLLAATGWRAHWRTGALFAVIGIFVFTPLQEQNLTNGFQLHFVLPLAFLLGGFCAATAIRHPWNFVATALLATAATFSMGSGLLSWIFILPLLIFRDDPPAARRRWFAIWGAAFLLNIIAYFIGYHLPPGSSSRLLEHPLAGVAFFLIYLGTPFTLGVFPSPAAAAIVGAVLLASSVAAAGALWFWRNETGFLRRALPWFLVVTTGLANGALTTVGRFQLGALKAMETRYVTYAVLVPIGLLVIGALICARVAGTGRARRSWTVRAILSLGAGMLVLHGLAVVHRLHSWPVERHDRLFIKAAVQTMDVVDEPLIRRYLSPSPTRLRETAHALARLGYLHPEPLRSASIADIGDPAAQGAARFGVLEQSGQRDDRVALMGWAVLPERLQPADAVLLTYDNAEGAPTIFALVEVIGPRPDVAAAIGTPDLAACGWRSMFATAELPAGATLIKAWAFDAEQRRAWRLAGSAAVHR